MDATQSENSNQNMQNSSHCENVQYGTNETACPATGEDAVYSLADSVTNESLSPTYIEVQDIPAIPSVDYDDTAQPEANADDTYETVGSEYNVVGGKSNKCCMNRKRFGIGLLCVVIAGVIMTRTIKFTVFNGKHNLQLERNGTIGTTAKLPDVTEKSLNISNEGTNHINSKHVTGLYFIRN